MTRYSLFSERGKDKPSDVFQYDKVPQKLRGQIIHIWRDVLPSHSSTWDKLFNIYVREIGVFILGRANQYKETQFCEYFMNCSDESALDMIDLSFNYFYSAITSSSFPIDRGYDYSANLQKIIKDSIYDLNIRMKENGIGYEFIEGSLIRIDNTFLHEETIKPFLKVLSKKGFEGAEKEFHDAFKHYKEGNIKEAITEANKSFESVMKILLLQNGVIGADIAPPIKYRTMLSHTL